MFVLYGSAASPFVRTVRVTLAETGLLQGTELRDVRADALDPDPALTAANPLAKIPALGRQDGPTLYDSRVICRYLDARSDAGLYPESRLWEILTLEATAHGVMEAAVAMVYEARFRPEDKVHEPWIEAQWSKVARALDAVESRWSSHLAGRVTAAQIALACALGYLDLRHDARAWRTGRPTLAGWQAGFAERDSMRDSAPA
ncbi:putative GST-like protein YibF [Roseivivax jejudonensis]|uniref:glutathione transferase n=1 Tax=Roseivivax jejudonensis TaxID=1529041 RepID=A0A1X6YB71_9RHOB|nr:glutathione S-transferase [Roseivivax jejudonensis]SLN15540.1 putative GST-like protein YibF [Roseivivax jejudonensis]